MKLTPINGNTETEGTPFVYRGIKLIVARSGNTEFKKSFREITKKYKDDIDNDRMSEETSLKVMIQCVAESILVGWEDFIDVDGNQFDYSVDNAIELLTDDEDCHEAVLAFSKNIDNYLIASQEELTGK